MSLVLSCFDMMWPGIISFFFLIFILLSVCRNFLIFSLMFYNLREILSHYLLTYRSRALSLFLLWGSSHIYVRLLHFVPCVFTFISTFSIVFLSNSASEFSTVLSSNSLNVFSAVLNCFYMDLLSS